MKNFLIRVAALGVHERADIAVNALLRVLADGAGVDHDRIRALFGIGDLIAALAEHAADLLGVRLVLLTAVGVHKGLGCAPAFPPERGDPAAVFPLQLQFFL